jgi:outer membrane protein assembly factor BamB
VPEEYKHDAAGKLIKYPSPEGPSEINATPVFYKNRVYVAIGQDPEHGEGVGHLVCVDATKEGDITKTGLIWDYKGIHRSISTVSIDPETGLLFVADFSGFVHCLDAETGKVYWTHDLQSNIWGSTLVADGKVYVGDFDGDLTIFSATKEKKILSQINMNAPVLSSPIAENGTIIIETQTHLYAIDGKGATSAGAVAPKTPAKK